MRVIPIRQPRLPTRKAGTPINGVRAINRSNMNARVWYSDDIYALLNRSFKDVKTSQLFGTEKKNITWLFLVFHHYYKKAFDLIQKSLSWKSIQWHISMQTQFFKGFISLNFLLNPSFCRWRLINQSISDLWPMKRQALTAEASFDRCGVAVYRSKLENCELVL